MLKILSSAVKQPTLNVRLLGRPCVECADKPLAFSTRKALAVFLYTACRAPDPVTRSKLCELLWGDGSDDRSTASLRKALSLLSKTQVIDDALDRGRIDLTFRESLMTIDLRRFWHLVALDTPQAHRDARALWTGPPLQDFTVGMAEFDDWVTTYRAGVVDEVVRVLSGHLAAKRAKNAPTTELVPLCELLTRVDPAEAAANETLIEVFRAQANASALNRQVQSYARALDELDVELPTMLRTRGQPGSQIQLATPTAELDKRTDDGRPCVAIVAPAVRPDDNSPLTYAHAELLSQITRFRRVRCEEVSACCNNSHLSGVGGDSKSDYRMLIWNEPTGRAIYLKCLNTRTRGTIAVRRLPYSSFDQPDDASVVMAAAINALVEAIASDEARFQSSAYARWLQAYRHICAFTPRSDTQANAILRGLMHDPDGQRLSVVYSSISQVAMRRRFSQRDGLLSADIAANAQAAVDHALALDPTEPYNHTMRGWLSLLTSNSDLGLGCFEDALALNPHCGNTIIAAAAAHARSGDIDFANELSARAGQIVGRNTQPYFHGLLAGVRYAAGDPFAALTHLQRGPRNLQMALYGVCAHHELGRADDAITAYQHMQMRQLEAMGSRTLNDMELDHWIRNAGPTRDPDIQEKMVSTVNTYKRIVERERPATSGTMPAAASGGEHTDGTEEVSWTV